MKGRKVPFDGEDDSSEHPVTYGRGVTIQSESGLELLRDPNIALGDVISVFRTAKQEKPERQYPEVAVTEIRPM